MSSTIVDVKNRSYKVLADNTVGAFVWNRLSFWTAAEDVEFDDGMDAETKLGDIIGITTSTSVTTTGYAADASVLSTLNTNVMQYVTDTLATGSTTLTFTNSDFTDNTLFDVYTSIYGAIPTDMSLSSTTLTITFDEQESDMTVLVHYWDPTA